eukprot:628993-Prymnesium_polylepis.1
MSIVLLDSVDTVLGACTVIWTSAAVVLCRTAAVASEAVERVTTVQVEVVDSGGGEVAGSAKAPNTFTLLASAATPSVTSVTHSSGSSE